MKQGAATKHSDRIHGGTVQDLPVHTPDEDEGATRGETGIAHLSAMRLGPLGTQTHGSRHDHANASRSYELIYSFIGIALAQWPVCTWQQYQIAEHAED